MALAPTIRPWITQGGHDVRSALRVIGRGNFEAVQLDVTLSGLRARELDQRARKDINALLVRQSLRLAGLDLFIPRKDFLASDCVDRAMSVAVSTLELAGDLGHIPVSLPLPVESLSSDVKAALVAAAEGYGVTLAIHAEDQLEALEVWLKEVNQPCLGAALDPASVIAAGDDPVATAQKLGEHLRVGRLSDEQAEGRLRCPVGQGELNLQEYRMTLDLATGRGTGGAGGGPVVLDLRGLENPIAAATTAQLAWEEASFSV